MGQLFAGRLDLPFQGRNNYRQVLLNGAENVHIPRRLENPALPQEHIVNPILRNPQQRNKCKTGRFQQLHRYAQTRDHQNESPSHPALMIF